MGVLQSWRAAPDCKSGILTGLVGSNPSTPTVISNDVYIGVVLYRYGSQLKYRSDVRIYC